MGSPLHSGPSLLLASLLLAANSPEIAAQEHLALSQYYHTAWTSRDGAPADVYALAQTSDGFLWLGATGGLFRFDGVHFELVDGVGGVQLQSGNVSTLLAVSDELWIGHRLGGVSLLTKDTLQNFGSEQGLPERSVWTLAQDSSGTMWAGTTVGLYRLERGKWRQVGPEDGVPQAWIMALATDARGRVWAATAEGVVRRDSAQGRFTLVHPVHATPPGERPNLLYLVLGQEGTGSIWLSGSLEGVRQLGGNYRFAAGQGRLPGQRTSALYVGRARDLWVAAGDSVGGFGLQHIWLDRSRRGGTPTESEVLSLASGLSGTEVHSILADREGNIWVGTSWGLDRFRRPKMVKAVLPQVVPAFTLAPADSGAIWVGSQGRGMLKVGATVEQLPSAPKFVECAYRDPDGVVWAGTKAGLWRSSGGRFVPVKLPAELIGPSKQAITRDASGAIWLSVVRKGVYRLTGGRWSKYGGFSRLPQEPALVLTSDEAGRTWFGYTGNRLALLQGDSVRLFTRAEGLAVGNVLSIQGRQPHVWVGGERGLARFDGHRFHLVHDRTGLSFRGTSGIVETSAGELWLHGAPGITRIPAAEVRRLAVDPSYAVEGERLDYRDGLDGIPEQLRPIPTAIAGTDGRIWFATSTGVYWMDPRDIPRNALPPLVAIRGLVAGGRSYSGTPGLQLPQRTTGVQIDFAAMGLSIPQRIRFRYQLVGSDTSWQDVGGRRQAFYTNLGPGSYRFRVIAANEDGVWNQRGAALAFTIPPAFTQSRWFLALCVAALAAAAWMLYRLRVRQVAGGLRARYQVALAERTRIAQDLHDTLLQGFTGVSLQVVAATERVSGPPEVIQTLHEVVKLAQQTLVDARQAIWDIRSADLEHQSLSDALEVAARTAVAGNGVGVSVATSGPARRMAPELETTALRVGREAILNAVRHAAPKHLDIALQYAPDQFVLQVRDDGLGMAANAVDGATGTGHWGVAGMRQRARRAGGDLDIVTQPGQGTVVSLRLPLDPVAHR
jgi:signal transduction histidine kinase/ligand-binding sensor domain-containing protein